MSSYLNNNIAQTPKNTSTFKSVILIIYAFTGPFKKLMYILHFEKLEQPYIKLNSQNKNT